MKADEDRRKKAMAKLVKQEEARVKKVEMQRLKNEEKAKAREKKEKEKKRKRGEYVEDDDDDDDDDDDGGGGDGGGGDEDVPPPLPPPLFNTLREAITHQRAVNSLDDNTPNSAFYWGHMRVRALRFDQVVAETFLREAVNQGGATLWERNGAEPGDEEDFSEVILPPQEQPFLCQTSSSGTAAFSALTSFAASMMGFAHDSGLSTKTQLAIKSLSGVGARSVFKAANTKVAKINASSSASASSRVKDSSSSSSSSILPLYFVWPTRSWIDSLSQPQRMFSSNLAFFNAKKGGVTTTFEDNDQFVKGALARYEPTHPSRQCAPHSKMWTLLSSPMHDFDDDKKIFLQQARAPLIIGSGNATISAWGSFRGDASFISNWEASVHFPQVLQLTLPTELAKELLSGRGGRGGEMAGSSSSSSSSGEIPSSFSLLSDALNSGELTILSQRPPEFEFAFRVTPTPYGEYDEPYDKAQDPLFRLG